MQQDVLFSRVTLGGQPSISLVPVHLVQGAHLRLRIASSLKRNDITKGNGFNKRGIFFFPFFKGRERLVIWLLSLFTLSLSSFSFFPCANEKGPLLAKVMCSPGARLGSALLCLPLNLLLQKGTPSPPGAQAVGTLAAELSRHRPPSIPLKAEIWCLNACRILTL